VDDQNFVDPIVPSLAVPMAKKTVEQRAPGPASGQSDGGTPTKETLVYDESVELQALQLSDLPMCPKCK
jgi:NAD-dependent deacetylase sirtuin 5